MIKSSQVFESYVCENYRVRDFMDN